MLRQRRQEIAAVYHGTVIMVSLVPIVLGLTLSIGFLWDAGATLLLIHGITFRRIPLCEVLQESSLPTFQCPECELEIDLAARWRCGCGFVSPERHAFSPCPSCGKGFAWIACPGCGTGILI